MTRDYREENKQPNAMFVPQKYEDQYEIFDNGNGSGSGPSTRKHADIKLSGRSSKSGNLSA
jgi:hypothetical protein